MGPRPFKIDREFLKTEVSEAEVETEKTRQEAEGGQCTVTDKGDVWLLSCKFFGGAGAGGGQ